MLNSCNTCHTSCCGGSACSCARRAQCAISLHSSASDAYQVEQVEPHARRRRSAPLLSDAEWHCTSGALARHGRGGVNRVVVLRGAPPRAIGNVSVFDLQLTLLRASVVPPSMFEGATRTTTSSTRLWRRPMEANPGTMGVRECCAVAISSALHTDGQQQGPPPRDGM